MKYTTLFNSAEYMCVYVVIDNHTNCLNSGVTIPEALHKFLTVPGDILNETELATLAAKPSYLVSIYEGDELPTRQSHPEFFI